MNDNFLRKATLAASIFLWPILLWPILSFGGDTHTAPSAALVEQLVEKDLVGTPGKELTMFTVEYLPGGASLPHRHDAQVLVYVLQGELTMQIAGSPAVILRQGQTFYESPEDVHLVSANASKTAPAKILVVMVKTKNAPVSRGVAREAAP